MRSYLADLVERADSPLAARSMVREYLQARILSGLQHAGAMIPLAFHGGTALRFLHAIPRYSEDLDFALERPEADYDFRRYLRTVQGELHKERYTLSIRVRDTRTVHSALVRFPGLLYDLGLSPHESEALSVKIEVDTRPPAGAGLVTTVVRRHVTLQLQHHDRPTLLSGKLHAILQRDYLKGRDIYDLVWYLSDPAWPAPNIEHLNHALAQTDWHGPTLSAHTWQTAVEERLAAMEWSSVVRDVQPFLEDQREVGLLSRETVSKLLG